MIQKWSRKFRDILVLVFNIFPRAFSAKGVVDLTGKVENALRSKSKSAAVHQKETKLNQKGRSASAIMSRGRCIDHPQKWKVLYLSIYRSRTVASQHDRDRTYESDVSTFELTRAQEASYPLPVNLLAKDFDYTIREVPHDSNVEDLSNERSASVETSEGT